MTLKFGKYTTISGGYETAHTFQAGGFYEYQQDDADWEHPTDMAQWRGEGVWHIVDCGFFVALDNVSLRQIWPGEEGQQQDHDDNQKHPNSTTRFSLDDLAKHAAGELGLQYTFIAAL